MEPGQEMHSLSSESLHINSGGYPIPRNNLPHSLGHHEGPRHLIDKEVILCQTDVGLTLIGDIQISVPDILLALTFRPSLYSRPTILLTLALQNKPLVAHF